MKFWKYISTIGLKADDSFDFIRKVQLINRLCFLSTATATVFIPLIYFIGNYFYAAVLCGFAPLCGLYFFFSFKRLFFVALAWSQVVTLISVFWGSIETPGCGVEFFLIPLSLIPFTIVERTKICICFVGIAAGALVLSHILQETYQPHSVVAPFYTKLTYIIGIVSTFVLTSIIIVQFKITNQKYESIIEEQKLIVEIKNKDITDSIKYAKRIQTSLLPTEKYIERILSRKDK